MKILWNNVKEKLPKSHKDILFMRRAYGDDEHSATTGEFTAWGSFADKLDLDRDNEPQEYPIGRVSKWVYMEDIE
jgi:hypothetical protein